MSKYLNVFNTLAEYQAFSASTEYVQPNVALVKETNVLYYDYGDNKPKVDMSDYKLETEETSVGGNKFGNSAITKINYIPSGITGLTNAFKDYTSLVNAPVIPSSVTNLNYTFNGCTSLVNAPEIPNSVGWMDNTFYGCSSLVNAPVIPSSVTSIESTFYGCSSLVNVPVIPSSVTSLYNTFNGCSSLKEVTFLHTTPPRYNKILYGCSKLESIYVPDEAVDTYKTATGWSQFASKIKPLSEKSSE